MVELLLLTMLSGVARAEVPRVVATRVADAPRIDGKLNERAWRDAFVARSFALLGSGGPATQATTARVLYDSRHLYFGLECAEDTRGAITTVVEARDGPVYVDDCVEVFSAPGPDPSSYYHFLVNARGTLRDELGRDERWNSRATAAAELTDTGWTAEIAVPLADLDLTAFVGSEWYVNFCREERPHAELSSWSPCQASFHEPGAFGKLTGVGIDVLPYARAGLRRGLDAATAQLRPVLRRAQAAQPLAAATAAVHQGAEVQADLRRAAALTNQRGAGAQELQEAETTLRRALSGLAELRTVLPRLNMSLALRRAGKPTGYAVCQESAMARIRPREPYEGVPADAVTVSLAAREYEAAQIVVAPIEKDLTGVRLGVTDLRGGAGKLIPSSEITINAVGTVTIKEPSGRSGASPGEYPDPLLPNQPRRIDREEVASWLVTVHAPAGQSPGVYSGRLTVEADNAPHQVLPFRVTVWGFELPRASALRTCFQLMPGYLWKVYDLPSAPGVPAGWEWGAWSGADANGVPNYFGTGVFEPRFETAQPHGGRRALCIEGKVAMPGAVEAPRACYHRVFHVKQQTEYEVGVWYRTQGLQDGQATMDVHTHGAHLGLPASDRWAEAHLRFSSQDKEEARLYLCNWGVGRVWFDDLRLAPAGEPDANVVDDPGFEQGGSYERRAELLKAYRLDALAHRLSDMNIASPRVEVSDSGEVRIDWAEFDRETGFYLEHGLNAFNVHWARVPGGWGSVSGTDDEAGLRVSAEILRQTQQHLAEKGWLDLAYIYTIDEPGKDAFPDVEAAFDHVHRAAPRLKRLLTLGYGASRPIEPGNPAYRRLEGYVDIWVPHSDCFESKFLEQRRRAGDEIWEYVCISAQKPYANIWGIDYPGTDPRVVFWQCFAQEITGFLYWATDYWEKDPWQDPLTYPGGNSDGSLFYYGPDGPVSSLRWETIRDGIEDYDTLVRLDSLVRRAEQQRGDPGLLREARKLLDVSDVTRSYVDYTTSPRAIERHRRAAARMVEQLTARLGGGGPQDAKREARG